MELAERQVQVVKEPWGGAEMLAWQCPADRHQWRTWLMVFTVRQIKSWGVAAAVNSGLPSVAHSSGIPNVVNVGWRQSTRPLDPSCALSMVGQLE